MPMKANSTRVKGKNFRDFCGKPLFWWTLNALLKVEEIDQIIINTDARHVLAENGLEETERIVIRDRNPEICGDHISMNLVIKDDIANIPSDIYLMTHTTNPLISSATISKALSIFTESLEANTADSLFTVDKVQSRFYKEDGTPINHDPDRLVPTQDLQVWYEENSNLYILTRESFSATNARIGLRPILFPTPKHESVDIDEPSDWLIAEAICKEIALR